jgi:hypothetical protein
MSNSKSLLKVALAAGLAWGALAVAQASASVASLSGAWVNTNPAARDITEVLVGPAGGTKVNVRVFGACEPTACDWGSVRGSTFSPSVAGNPLADAVAATAHYRLVILRQAGPNLLRYEIFSDFDDGSGRNSYIMGGMLRRAPRLIHLPIAPIGPLEPHR